MQMLTGLSPALWTAIAICAGALVLAFRAMRRARRATHDARELRKELAALQAKYDEECKWRQAVENHDTDILSPRGLRWRLSNAAREFLELRLVAHPAGY